MTTSTNSTRLTSKEACTLAHKIRRETGCSLAEAFKQAYSSSRTSTSPKTSWTKAELAKIFSDKVAELLRKGYTIDVDHMSGSQGEIAKMLFIKDNTHYQLLMKEEFISSTYVYNYSINIRFGKYTEDEAQVSYRTTLWINEFKTSWEFSAVKITDNYFVTEEMAALCRAKYDARMTQRHSDDVKEMDLNRYGKTILACVRKQKGYKATKLSDIATIRRVNDYDSWRGGNCIGHHYSVELSSKQDKWGKNIWVRINLSKKAN